MNTKPDCNTQRYILPSGFEIDGAAEAKRRASVEAEIEQLRSAAAAACLDTIEGRIKQAELLLKIAKKQAFLAGREETLASAEPLPPSGAWEEPLRRARERAQAAGKPSHRGPGNFELPIGVQLAQDHLTALKLERLEARGRKASRR